MPQAAETYNIQPQYETLSLYLLAGIDWPEWMFFPLLPLLKCLVLQKFLMMLADTMTSAYINMNTMLNLYDIQMLYTYILLYTVSICNGVNGSILRESVELIFIQFDNRRDLNPNIRQIFLKNKNSNSLNKNHVLCKSSKVDKTYRPIVHIIADPAVLHCDVVPPNRAIVEVPLFS